MGDFRAGSLGELLGSLGVTTSFPPLGGAHGPFSAGLLASFGGESLVGVPFKVTPDPISPRTCVVLENPNPCTHGNAASCRLHPVIGESSVDCL